MTYKNNEIKKVNQISDKMVVIPKADSHLSMLKIPHLNRLKTLKMKEINENKFKFIKTK